MAKERESGPLEQIGETMGSTVGKVVGRANDMAAGAAASLFGQAIETLGDWWTNGAEQAARTFGEREDRACREHHGARAQQRPATGSSAPRDYESARPLYQFGYVAGQNPEYQARPFDRVEADLERAWEAVGRDRFGEWPEVRDEVSFGYTFRAGGAPNPS